MRLNKSKPLALALLLVTGCSDNEPTSCMVTPSSLTEISELMSVSQEQVTIDKTTLELHAHVATDPLFAVTNVFTITTLVDVDSVAIPNNILLSEQYVINGNDLWISYYTDERPETEPYKIVRISRDGPEWNPEMKDDIEVTVIARVVDLNDCSEYYLIDHSFMICDC